MSLISLNTVSSDTSTIAGTLNSNSFPPLKDYLAYEKCPRCKHYFDFLKRGSVSKVPLILPCKHTICENCIHLMCTSNKALCPMCHEKFTVLRSQLDSLSDVFHPHFSLIGQLVWTKNCAAKSNSGWVSTGVTLKRQRAGSTSTIDDSSMDLDSKSDFSEDNFEGSTSSFLFDKCPEHNGQDMNIYCEECNASYCCYCFIENHTGHKASHLYKLNDTEITKIQENKRELQVVLGQLLSSKRKVKELNRFDTFGVDQDIKSRFAYLHAELYLTERNIRKKLLAMEADPTPSGDLEVLSESLSTNVSRVVRILKLISNISSSNRRVNVRSLLQEIEELRDIPCRLVSDKGLLRPIEFMVDDVLDNFEDHFSISTNSAIEYNLLPIDNWEETQEYVSLEDLKQLTVGSDEDVRSIKDISLERTQTPVVPIPTPKDAKTKENVSRLKEGKVRVVVTHINDLNSFYIQKCVALDMLREMQSNISKRSRKNPNNEVFKKGGIYAVSYAHKSTLGWRRGKLLDIIRTSTGELQYKMFFIDYGNTQCVNRNKIKEVDMRTVLRPPFALECRLTNPDKTVYSATAHLRLPQIIEEKELYLQYVSKANESSLPKEVDLFVATSNGGLVSVRDFLSGGSISSVQTEFDTNMKLFKNSKTFCLGQADNVSIVYIQDPFYLCVQLVQSLNIMENMRENMARYYRDQPQLSCIPVVDTDVIVKYESETQGNWHRAKITSVNHISKEVEVSCVDWGRDLVVPWSALRLLTEEFIKIESQGIIIRLAHVEKMDMSQPWSKGVVDFLYEQLSQQVVTKMVVTNLDPLEVALFQIFPSSDICVNALLVEKQYAMSTGSISQTLCWPNAFEGEENEDDDLACQMVKKTEEVLMMDEEDEHLQTGVRLRVQVLSVKNPDLIHVKLSKFSENDEELHKDLQIHYSSSKGKTKPRWKADEKCVILDSRLNNYFRAVIKEPKDDKKKYLVYLYDQGREMIIPRDLIYVQDVYFDSFPCCVFKCKLSNIRPAGDREKWSNFAIELLEKIFATHKLIYIKKIQRNLKTKTVGVLMWYCLTSAPKALEPSKVNFICINKFLVESGVAFNAHKLEHGINGIKEENDVGDGLKSGDEDTHEKKDWNEIIEEEQEEQELISTGTNSWPCPKKLKDREFNAVLTCIDSAGCFFVRDDELQELYLQLEENLTEKLNTFHESEPQDWAVSDTCTILFEGKWYRATVLALLNDKEISVEMIDFGSEHCIPKESLSPRLMFLDLPPLVYKVSLYDVFSKNGDWSEEEVNALLEIVSDNVRISVKGKLDADIPEAEIYLPNGLSVNDLIITKCPHMERYETKAVLGSLSEITEFEQEPTPKTTEVEDNYIYKCFCQPITKKQNLFLVNVLRWDTNYSVVLSSTGNYKTAKTFTKVKRAIQRDVDKQAALVNIVKNASCVCLNRGAKEWGRALVHNVGSLKYGCVSVFFVDYGSVEMVPTKDLREIKPEWLHFPVCMQLATLNVKLLQSDQAEYVLMHLKDLIGKSVQVEVVSEAPLRVHIYNKEDLVYGNFLSCGILELL